MGAGLGPHTKPVRGPPKLGAGSDEPGWEPGPSWTLPLRGRGNNERVSGRRDSMTRRARHWRPSCPTCRRGRHGDEVHPFVYPPSFQNPEGLRTHPGIQLNQHGLQP